MLGSRVVVLSALCCWMLAASQQYPRRHHRASQQASRTLSGSAIPVMRLLKRMVRNFREGYTARVTLVFKATTEVQVRWFRQHTAELASDAEVPNMLPVEGDPLYTLSTMMSGYLTATTISVPAFQEKFPVRLETILTTRDGTMQYQLTTVIQSAKDLSSSPEDIYSPEWQAVPSPLWSVDRHRAFVINCKILVSNEKVGFTNEMVLFHAYEDLNSRSKLVGLQKIFEVHKDTPNRPEEHGPTTFQGRRSPLADRRSFIYDMNMTASNATQALEGVYQCVFEREREKSFVISQLALAGRRSPFPKTPRVAFMSCAPNNHHRSTVNKGLLSTVNLTEGIATCLRCRGFGYPRPQVAMFHGETEVQSSASVGVSKFISVADAGLVEATYTLHAVGMQHAGNYTCRAENLHKMTRLNVVIVVYPASS